MINYLVKGEEDPPYIVKLDDNTEIFVSQSKIKEFLKQFDSPKLKIYTILYDECTREEIWNEY